MSVFNVLGTIRNQFVCTFRFLLLLCTHNVTWGAHHLTEVLKSIRTPHQISLEKKEKAIQPKKWGNSRTPVKCKARDFQRPVPIVPSPLRFVWGSVQNSLPSVGKRLFFALFGNLQNVISQWMMCEVSWIHVQQFVTRNFGWIVEELVYRKKSCATPPPISVIFK